MPDRLGKFRDLIARLWHNPLWSNTADLAILQMVGYVLPLVSMPYLVRVLGTSNYGLFALVLAVVGYFGAFADFGYGYTAVRAVASTRSDSVALSRTVSSTTLAKLACGSVVWVSLVASSWALPLPPDLAHLMRVASPLVLLSVANPAWYFQGLQRVRPMVIWQIVVRILGLLLLFAIVRRRGDVPAAVSVELAIALASAVGGWALMLRLAPIPPCRPTRDELLKSLSESAQMFASTLASLLYTNALTIVLGIVGSREQIAYYAIADRLNNAVKRLLTPLLQALVPHVNRMRESSHQATIDFLRRILHSTVLLGAVSTLMVIAAAPVLIQIIGGRAIAPALWVFWIMSPQALLIAVSNILGVQGLFSFQIVKPIVRAQSFVGLLTLLLAFPAAMRFQSVGVAAAGTLAEFAIVAIYIHLSRKHLNFP